MSEQLGVGAVVLAAGMSRRMGQPKLVMPWHETTVIGQVVDVLLTLGDRARVIADAARRVTGKRRTIVEFSEFEPLLDWLKINLTPKDVVLIKGSHGLRMDRITSALEVRS